VAAPASHDRRAPGWSRAEQARRAGGPALLCAAALAAIAACRPAPGGDAGRPDPIPVRTETVRIEPSFAIREAFPGRVLARREAELGFELPGRLEAVSVDTGAGVEAGAELARLDRVRLEARRAELAARLDEIRAELALARATLARQAALRRGDHVSVQRYEEALRREQVLAARLEAATASLRALEVDLDKTVLRAPFAGTVTARLADEGQVLAAGRPVLRMVEAGAMEVRVGVPPEVALELSPGSLHEVAIGGAVARARLRAIVPTVDPRTRTAELVLDLPDPPAMAGHGALARLLLERRIEGRGAWVPLDALSEGRRGLWTVFVVHREEGSTEAAVAERRDVQVLHFDGDRAFVRGALADGELIVATGVRRLVPGQPVRLLDGR